MPWFTLFLIAGACWTGFLCGCAFTLQDGGLVHRPGEPVEDAIASCWHGALAAVAVMLLAVAVRWWMYRG